MKKGDNMNKRVDWQSAQKYELAEAFNYMNNNNNFKKLLKQVNTGEINVSKGYYDNLIISEFFSNDLNEWKKFLNHIHKKTVLEIGPCLISVVSTWDIAQKRIVIEPLLNEIKKYQNNIFHMDGFPNTVGYSLPAEKLIEELVGKIDGAILIRNCLDHTPYWPFILSNISDYLISGGYLLLWNDLLHPKSYEDGHYDIIDNIDSFKRLIVKFGFEIISEYQEKDRHLNYGCRAIKK